MVVTDGYDAAAHEQFCPAKSVDYEVHDDDNCYEADDAVDSCGDQRCALPC